MIDGNKITDTLIGMIKDASMAESDRSKLITVAHYLYQCFDEQDSLIKQVNRLEKDNYSLAKKVLESEK